MNRCRFWLVATLVLAACVGVGLARGGLHAHEEPAPARPAVVWEYNIMSRLDLSRLGEPDLKVETGVVNYDAVQRGLNKLGSEGWELSAMESSGSFATYYFKRPRAAK